MKVNKRQRLVIDLILVLAVAIGAYLVFLKPNSIPDGYVQVQSYVHPRDPDQYTCDAIKPSCGVCVRGVVIDEKCYVPADSSHAGH